MTRLTVCLSALIAVALLATGTPSLAASDQDALVERARLTVQNFERNKDVGPSVKNLMKTAKAVVIFPAVLKGAFIIGAEGGSGVLLAKGSSGKWSYPAFYTMGGASFGLQIGGQSSEVMLLIMTNKGINSVINNKVKLGADISAAVGPVGVGAEASTTTNLRADILSFSVNAGAFIGASLAGAVIAPRQAWNTNYYNSANATAKAVVLDGKYFNVQADPLRKTLAGLN